jgi:hypothetical protein
MTGTVLDHVLAFLIPLFLKGAGDDPALARRAAIELLESHNAATARELLLAAEIIAFSFATLDNLGKSMADPDMSISTRLRLRSNANALSRATERSRNNLERARKQMPEGTKIPTATPSPPTAIQKVRDAIVEAAPCLAQTLTDAGQSISRQQRRFLTRKAEQVRAAREREVRKTARLAIRTTVRT